jgi:hypothetical protein
LNIVLLFEPGKKKKKDQLSKIRFFNRLSIKLKRKVICIPWYIEFQVFCYIRKSVILSKIISFHASFAFFPISFVSFEIRMQSDFLIENISNQFEIPFIFGVLDALEQYFMLILGSRLIFLFCLTKFYSLSFF